MPAYLVSEIGRGWGVGGLGERWGRGWEGQGELRVGTVGAGTGDGQGREEGGHRSRTVRGERYEVLG